ncbi:hypothetical protein BN8_02925 [Fibrisoma limi BUZ 3]|uniref:Outer membrane protein beta-barrel domain-containing protein n=1 Tax=Fibrisoma limi BUZ 3 TaxID=1185876 RepID=I2GIS5_9BACT|nr:hypothetical protein [Fibrisoma limi]CCH53800.1 hypothetical protein BN8_02925 [Fibrisoma limi BUZ 3]
MNIFSKLTLVPVLLAAQTGIAQDRSSPPASRPLTVSVFSESVSLPTFRGFLRKPNVGVRIGTEFYYRNRPGSQLIQTLNVGFYHHRNVHSGLYLNTEFGYRKFIGNLYAEGFIGVGGLGLSQQLRSYQRTETGDYKPASRFLVRVMPSVSAGVGYRFRPQSETPVSVFARYELFGETPFSNRGVPVLPHSAFHIGTRFLVHP